MGYYVLEPITNKSIMGSYIGIHSQPMVKVDKYGNSYLDVGNLIVGYTVKYVEESTAGGNAYAKKKKTTKTVYNDPIYEEPVPVTPTEVMDKHTITPFNIFLYAPLDTGATVVYTENYDTIYGLSVSISNNATNITVTLSDGLGMIASMQVPSVVSSSFVALITVAKNSVALDLWDNKHKHYETYSQHTRDTVTFNYKYIVGRGYFYELEVGTESRRSDYWETRANIMLNAETITVSKTTAISSIGMSCSHRLISQKTSSSNSSYILHKCEKVSGLTTKTRITVEVDNCHHIHEADTDVAVGADIFPDKSVHRLVSSTVSSFSIKQAMYKPNNSKIFHIAETVDNLALISVVRPRNTHIKHCASPANPISLMIDDGRHGLYSSNVWGWVDNSKHRHVTRLKTTVCPRDSHIRLTTHGNVRLIASLLVDSTFHRLLTSSYMDGVNNSHHELRSPSIAGNKIFRRIYA